MSLQDAQKALAMIERAKKRGRAATLTFTRTVKGSGGYNPDTGEFDGDSVVTFTGTAVILQASQGTVEACKYGPRPFAFRRSDYSDAGTRQDAYVTDYVIRQEEIGSPWTRASVPAICYTGDGGIDYIFADGFDPFE